MATEDLREAEGERLLHGAGHRAPRNRE
jgi:hypothetical protein